MAYVDANFIQMPLAHLRSKSFDEAAEAEAVKGGECPAVICVRDNGTHGDGCTVRILFGPEFSDKDPGVYFVIPDDQIETLAEVFNAIVKLRRIDNEA